MTDCRITTSGLVCTPRARRSASQSQEQRFSTPLGSPTQKTTPTGLDDYEEDDYDKENNLSAQDRLLRSPTDKLLSPVSRALKAHKRSPKRGVRTSLTSLLDEAS